MDDKCYLKAQFLWNVAQEEEILWTVLDFFLFFLIFGNDTWFYSVSNKLSVYSSAAAITACLNTIGCYFDLTCKRLDLFDMSSFCITSQASG